MHVTLSHLIGFGNWTLYDVHVTWDPTFSLDLFFESPVFRVKIGETRFILLLGFRSALNESPDARARPTCEHNDAYRKE